MSKVLLKTAVFATIASFAVTGQVWAHHPSEDVNPNYDFVDEQISDMHDEAIDERMDDGDSFMNSLRSSGGSTSQSQETSGSNTSTGPAGGRR